MTTNGIQSHVLVKYSQSLVFYCLVELMGGLRLQSRCTMYPGGTFKLENLVMTFSWFAKFKHWMEVVLLFIPSCESSGMGGVNSSFMYGINQKHRVIETAVAFGGLLKNCLYSRSEKILDSSRALSDLKRISPKSNAWTRRGIGCHVFRFESELETTLMVPV